MTVNMELNEEKILFYVRLCNSGNQPPAWLQQCKHKLTPLFDDPMVDIQLACECNNL